MFFLLLFLDGLTYCWLLYYIPVSIKLKQNQTFFLYWNSVQIHFWYAHTCVGFFQALFCCFWNSFNCNLAVDIWFHMKSWFLYKQVKFFLLTSLNCELLSLFLLHMEMLFLYWTFGYDTYRDFYWWKSLGLPQRCLF